MRLFWGPHTCAIGIHILLEETGARYDTQKLDVSGGETQQPAFLAVNPKGKVPTLLRDDGSVLTEFGAIATWLARTHRGAALIPADTESEVRGMEIMEYVEGTIHGQGFGRIFNPARFEPQDVLHGKAGLGRANVEHQGRAIVEKAFALLNAQLADREFAAGNTFSIADAALFYVERWAPQKDIQLPPHVDRHFQRLLQRPSVQTVRAYWGES
jgi:glutathione S-transferase